MRKKLTKEYFIKISKNTHNQIFDYSLVEYKNNKTNVKIICPTHGVFEQTPKNHMIGSGCPKCALESKYNSQRKTKEEFIKESMVTHDYFYNYSLVEYKNNKTNVKIICPTHGVFTQKPSHHLNGSTCPECSGNKVTEKKFIENSLIKHNGKYDYSLIEYENLRSKVLIICPIHGKFKQLCKYHMNGSGCPECGESKGEKKVKSFLIENNIEFNPQYKFGDCKNILPLPFDFYLPDLNICVEYDGRQHFKPIKIFGGEEGFKKTQINDKIKNEYCLENNIQLIRIKYNEDINNKLNKFLKMK